ncbi:MAG: hypothetical protein WC088_06625, partial [Candidatus Izemoplasmatales bacterium]
NHNIQSFLRRALTRLKNSFLNIMLYLRESIIVHLYSIPARANNALAFLLSINNLSGNKAIHL